MWYILMALNNEMYKKNLIEVPDIDTELLAPIFGGEFVMKHFKSKIRGLRG